MRVALLCPYSLSRPGGVQGQVLGLAAALADAGHDAVVLAPADGDAEVPGLGPECLDPTRPVDCAARPTGRWRRWRSVPAAAVRAVRAVRHGGFDVLHLHEPLASGSRLRLSGGVQYTQGGHVSPRREQRRLPGARSGGQVLGPAARRRAAPCRPRPSPLPSTRWVASYEIIGNGVDMARFATARPSPTSGPTVLFVGRHEERKGLGVLLEAVTLLDPHTELTVWVAGEGPDTEALRRRHPPSSRLQWLGRIDDAELASRLAGAHALCAPALRGESFGVVLLEAMAARAAVVASDLPGYAAVVQDHGLLVTPGDPGALAGALERRGR